MKLDLKLYSINKEFIQKKYKESVSKGLDEVDVISLFSPLIHCPLVALAFYLAEDIGFTPKLIRTIDRLIGSYGYKEIVNQKEGSPYLHLDSSCDIKD